MFEFDGILLKPCLLQPCFHVAGASDMPQISKSPLLIVVAEITIAVTASNMPQISKSPLLIVVAEMRTAVP